eukprot:6402745-Alexandrium_andersonii.AAC.1
MSASLVGSEMCIRDRARTPIGKPIWRTSEMAARATEGSHERASTARQGGCLLYTSDAADDM